VRTDRPEEVKAQAPPPRPQRPAAAKAAKPWFTHGKVTLTPDQQSVLEDAKIQLKAQGAENIPEALIAQFVIVKKVTSAVVTSVKGYRQWANLLDYETLPWERIEKEIKRGLFTVPNAPFAEGPNNSVALFINSHHFEPRAGSRAICATLWLHLHYILAKSDNAAENGIAVVNQGSGITYSKFYPAIQKTLLESLQSVLPMRVAAMYMVDPPYLFKMLWGIVSGWLSEKLRERFFVLSSDNITKHFDKSLLPTYLKGDLQYSPEQRAAWVEELKKFYTEEFQPMMVSIADAPGSVKAPELFEPAGSH
jgi:hypothetical protein